MVELFDPPRWARDARPAAVAATSSAAPRTYIPIGSPPAIYDVVSHGAQYGNGRRYGITNPTLIVLHTTESASFTGNLIYDMRRPETVGATAFYGDSKLAYTTPEHQRPWTTGRWNDGSLSLEVCGKAAWSRIEWLTAEPDIVNGLTRILVDWCRRYKIAPVWLTAEQIAEGASRSGGNPWRPMGVNTGICDHRLANDAAIMLGHSVSHYSHTDIGAGLRDIVTVDVMPAVVKAVTPPPPIVQPPEIINPPEETATMPPFLIRYKGIATFLPDGTLCTDETVAEYRRVNPALPVLDSQADTDTQFVAFLEKAGAVAAFELGRRAERNSPSG